MFLFVESADTTSLAHQIVSESFADATDEFTDWCSTPGATAPSRTTLRATMGACQWIGKDAIERGLTDEVVTDAKSAPWLLVSRVFGIE